MKLGLYKVDNSLGYERHTFDALYDKPRKIEEMLQPLLDKGEAVIVNLETEGSVDEFVGEYNDKIYDGGWWSVLIRDCKDEKRTYVVTYVGLSDSEYNANGYSECHLYCDKEAAFAKLKALRDAEIADLKEQGRDYEILEDEEDKCRISWCGHGEQVRIEVHKEKLVRKEKS